MSSFLKFAYELLSQVVYNIVSWLVAFLNLFITGWVQYFLIFKTYFFSFGIPQKILSILLMILLFAIPVTDSHTAGAQGHHASSAEGRQDG